MQELLIQSLEIDWSEIDARDYLRSIHAIQAIERLEFHSPVTFFAGENGSGKSTLLEAIAVAQGFNPEGGTKNYSFSTYDSHSGLAEALRLVRGARRAKMGIFFASRKFLQCGNTGRKLCRIAVPVSGLSPKIAWREFFGTGTAGVPPARAVSVR